MAGNGEMQPRKISTAVRVEHSSSPSRRRGTLGANEIEKSISRVEANG